jgi:hypothetical protein
VNGDSNTASHKETYMSHRPKSPAANASSSVPEHVEFVQVEVTAERNGLGRCIGEAGF